MGTGRPCGPNAAHGGGGCSGRRHLRGDGVGPVVLGRETGRRGTADSGEALAHGPIAPAAAARRMLYWHDPFPIYDATYIFKVYPRKKTGTFTYYTTFFWGNDGTFIWQN